MLYSHNHNNTTKKKDERNILLEICVPLTLFVTFERITQGLHVRGSWRPNRNCNILTPLLWPSASCLSRSPAGGPVAQLSAG